MASGSVEALGKESYYSIKSQFPFTAPRSGFIQFSFNANDSAYCYLDIDGRFFGVSKPTYAADFTAFIRKGEKIKVTGGNLPANVFFIPLSI